MIGPDYGSLYRDKKQLSGFLGKMEERSVRKPFVMVYMLIILTEVIISLVYMYIIKLGIFHVIYCILMISH